MKTTPFAHYAAAFLGIALLLAGLGGVPGLFVSAVACACAAACWYLGLENRDLGLQLGAGSLIIGGVFFAFGLIFWLRLLWLWSSSGSPETP